MIKVAVAGADSPEAGELIRILVNHPDVELRALIAPRLDGADVCSRHHGLVGETQLKFCASLPEKTDVLFVCGAPIDAAAFRHLRDTRKELKIILLHPVDGELEPDEEQPVYGLPEINRKALVRGARLAVVPSPMASLALVPLYPLAYNLLLNGHITLRYYVPFFLAGEERSRNAAAEVRGALAEAQRSFTGDMEAGSAHTAAERGAELDIELPCAIELDHIMEMYEMYDDHHFAFPLTAPVSLADVEGTEKCLFTISKPDRDTLRIHAVADTRMRGGAGEAVHIMNLLCQLHEKTGLALKASRF